MPSYMLVFVLPWLIRGVAFLVLAIRAEKEDLPAIARAFTGTGPKDNDGADTPPSLPKS
jgi:hypothetical protein